MGRGTDSADRMSELCDWGCNSRHLCVTVDVMLCCVVLRI